MFQIVLLVLVNQKGIAIYKPKKLHNGEHPDGHDNGDDDDLVHVWKAHHDEVSIGCIIVHLDHHRDQLLLLFSRLAFLN